MKKLTPLQSMKKSRAGMLMKYRFFGILAVQTELVEVEDNSNIFTMATDGERIFYSPKFAMEMDDEGRQFVISHEILHNVTMSMGRRGTRDPKLWNYATDYAINQLLVDHGMKMPTDDKMSAVLGRKVNMGLLDARFRGLTAERIYDILNKERDDEEKKVGLSGGKGGQGLMNGNGQPLETIDSHDIWDKLGKDKKAAEKAARRWKTLATMAATQTAGTTPEGIRRLIKDLNEPVISWRDHLIMTMASNTKSDYSRVPPDKRYFGMGMTMPRLYVDNHLRVSVVIDTSGSITDEMVRDVMSEIVGICSQYNSWEMQVMSFDHELYDPMIFESSGNDDVTTHPIRGCGGTSFGPAIKYIAGDMDYNGQPNSFTPDQVIFFTDGYGDGWYEDYADRLNMIWILPHGSSANPTWGTTIRYDMYA